MSTFAYPLRSSPGSRELARPPAKRWFERAILSETAGVYGFSDLGRFSHALEKAAEKSDVAEIESSLRRIADYLARVRVG
ncbi:hypothetical protein WDW86_04620 [Bdellovibrionota bacterium FG-2]